MVNNQGPAVLLINQSASERPYLRLRILERAGAPALGARVHLPELGHQQTVRAAYSYQASSEPVVHIGLGDRARPASAEVTWTDGESECFALPSGESEVTLRRGRGGACSPHDEAGAEPKASEARETEQARPR